MGARQKRWAKVARVKLSQALGSRCAACADTERLTFDCMVPAGSGHHSFESSQRMCFYRRQARQGNLQLLCEQCNAIKSGLTLAQWQSAVSFVMSSDRLHRGSRSPGQGTGLSSLEFRQCLCEWVSRFHADTARLLELKSDSPLVVCPES